MKINGKDVKNIRVEHQGYGYTYECYLKPGMTLYEETVRHNEECKIEIADIEEIDYMIALLQKAKRVIEDGTRWKKEKPIWKRE